MVEKKLNVCDACEERIAKVMCDVCKIDLCNVCSRSIPIFYDNITIKVCKKCELKSKRLLANKNFYVKLIEKVSGLIKSEVILENIEEDD